MAGTHRLQPRVPGLAIQLQWTALQVRRLQWLP